MTSLRQSAANRENAKKSKGPTSPEGRARSRRNSLKHGLSGAGIVLPDETEEQIQAQIAVWSQGFKGWDDRDMAVLERAAVEHLRVVDSQRIERDLRIKQCQRAETHWEIDRRAIATRLFAKLHRNPIINAISLEFMLHGCDLMIDRWVGLLSGLENGQPWNEKHRSQALDVLGVPRDFRDVRTRIDARPGEAIVDVQKQVAESELERLRALRDNFLVVDDEDEREATMIGLGIVDHPTSLIRRYEAVSQKRLREAMKWLERSRKRGGKPAPEPAPKRRSEPDMDALRLYTMEKLTFEKASGSLRTNPKFVEAVDAANVCAVAVGYPPIKLSPLPTPRPTTTPLGELLVTSIRDEAAVEEIDEQTRRARRPDPAKIRKNMRENLARQAKSSKKR